jgi:hypothetical protein
MSVSNTYIRYHTNITLSQTKVILKLQLILKCQKDAIFEVLTMVLPKIQFLWNVTLYLGASFLMFKGAAVPSHDHLKCGGTTDTNTASPPRRNKSSVTKTFHGLSHSFTT